MKIKRFCLLVFINVYVCPANIKIKYNKQAKNSFYQNKTLIFLLFHFSSQIICIFVETSI